jgi:beta-glucosidase
MDNYEWTAGHRPESCFGLVHVDRATLARTPKASARWYQQVAASHTV